MENKMLIPVKNLQIGDLLIFGTEYAFSDGNTHAAFTEEIVGVGINLCHGTVDVQTPTRAVFDVPMDLEIEVIRS